MKSFITKSLLTSVLLIFMGLSVSAGRNTANYQFGGTTVISPYSHTASDAKQDDMLFGSGPQRGFGGGTDEPFGDGGGDPSDGVNDGDGGSGGGFGGGDDDDFDDGGGTDPGCAYNDCPAGEGMFILLILAAAYAGFVFRRKSNNYYIKRKDCQ